MDLLIRTANVGSACATASIGATMDVAQEASEVSATAVAVRLASSGTCRPETVTARSAQATQAVSDAATASCARAVHVQRSATAMQDHSEVMVLLPSEVAVPPAPLTLDPTLRLTARSPHAAAAPTAHSLRASHQLLPPVPALLAALAAAVFSVAAAVTAAASEALPHAAWAAVEVALAEVLLEAEAAHAAATEAVRLADTIKEHPTHRNVFPSAPGFRTAQPPALKSTGSGFKSGKQGKKLDNNKQVKKGDLPESKSPFLLSQHQHAHLGVCHARDFVHWLLVIDALNCLIDDAMPYCDDDTIAISRLQIGQEVVRP